MRAKINQVLVRFFEQNSSFEHTRDKKLPEKGPIP